ncbi:unnamed protein product, partial [Hapterophycus canaliculatus]
MNQNRPPPYPRDENKRVGWLRLMDLFLNNEELGHTLTEDARIGPVRVISSSRDTLLHEHPGRIVQDHARAYSLISSSVAGTDLDERLQSCSTVAEAWRVLHEWVLPSTLAQKRLLKEQFNNVPFPVGGHPNAYSAKFDRLGNMLRAVGVEVTEGEKVQAMIDQLPDEYAIQKAILREKPDVSRREVEEILGNAYADRRVKEMRERSSAPNAA